MDINTTIYVHNDILQRIREVAGNNIEFRNKLIIILLKRATRDHNILEKNFRCVKYQDDDTANKWTTLHVKFGKGENEYFQDMRRVFKMSVSLILAYSVKNYLIEVLNDLAKIDHADNYPPQNYLILKDIVDEVVCWRLFWGIPRNIDKIFKL